jgi:hypothetical protein
MDGGDAVANVTKIINVDDLDTNGMMAAAIEATATAQAANDLAASQPQEISQPLFDSLPVEESSDDGGFDAE